MRNGRGSNNGGRVAASSDALGSAVTAHGLGEARDAALTSYELLAPEGPVLVVHYAKVDPVHNCRIERPLAAVVHDVHPMRALFEVVPHPLRTRHSIEMLRHLDWAGCQRSWQVKAGCAGGAHSTGKTAQLSYHLQFRLPSQRMEDR